jgi:hypothetical protein
VGGTEEKPNYATDVIADIGPTIHQHSLQGTNSNKVIKPSIIMQTHNSTTQHIETVLNVVNRVNGDPPKHRHGFKG